MGCTSVRLHNNKKVNEWMNSLCKWQYVLEAANTCQVQNSAGINDNRYDIKSDTAWKGWGGLQSTLQGKQEEQAGHGSLNSVSFEYIEENQLGLGMVQAGFRSADLADIESLAWLLWPGINKSWFVLGPVWLTFLSLCVIFCTLLNRVHQSQVKTIWFMQYTHTWLQWAMNIPYP